MPVPALLVLLVVTFGLAQLSTAFLQPVRGNLQLPSASRLCIGYDKVTELRSDPEYLWFSWQCNGLSDKDVRYLPLPEFLEILRPGYFTKQDKARLVSIYYPLHPVKAAPKVINIMDLEAGRIIAHKIGSDGYPLSLSPDGLVHVDETDVEVGPAVGEVEELEVSAIYVKVALREQLEQREGRFQRRDNGIIHEAHSAVQQLRELELVSWGEQVQVPLVAENKHLVNYGDIFPDLQTAFDDAMKNSTPHATGSMFIVGELDGVLNGPSGPAVIVSKSCVTAQDVLDAPLQIHMYHLYRRLHPNLDLPMLSRTSS